MFPTELIKHIENGNVVAKTVSMTANDDTTDSPDRLLFLLEQLRAPTYFRPTKNRKITPADRTITFANRDLTIRPNLDKQHTKKSAVTLLPAHGKIELYMPRRQNPIGLLFRLDQCDLKGEQYIFPGLAQTDQGDNRHTRAKISLTNLKQNLNDHSARDTIAPVNELDIGLSKESLIGIFAPVNDQKTIQYARKCHFAL